MDCDVCGKDNAVGAASLPFAPMSVCFCVECLRARAFPLWSIHTAIELAEGPDGCADWFKELKSYHDGEYIGWDEILRLMEIESNGQVDDRS